MNDMHSKRLGDHRLAAELLERTTDEALIDALDRTSASTEGHACIRLEGGGPFFVKLLPLSALERTPESRESSGNIFRLPPYFHYRIGSCGFSAWRELEIHLQANRWVSSGESRHFPLLHHWRVLPISRTPQFTDLKVWGDVPAIRDRFSAVAESSFVLALFSEHIPKTLSAQFREDLAHQPMAAITELQTTLLQQIAFIHSRRVLHMDAHFDNILTDGHALFWSDFGLALSRDFQLDSDEREFFEAHHDFDSCTVITSLVHGVVSYYDAREDWRSVLRELVSGIYKGASIPAEVQTYLLGQASLVLAVGEFYAELIEDLTTPFPAARLRALLAS